MIDEDDLERRRAAVERQGRRFPFAWGLAVAALGCAVAGGLRSSRRASGALAPDPGLEQRTIGAAALGGAVLIASLSVLGVIASSAW